MRSSSKRALVLEELGACLGAVSDEQVEGLTRLLALAPRIMVAGRGRTGLMMSAFAMRLMQLGLDAHVVGEVSAPPVRQGDLLVLGSGSGETASLVAWAEKTRDVGGSVALVTANPESTLAGLSGTSVLIPATTPKAAGAAGTASVQPMASLFEQSTLLLLDSVILRLQESLGQSSEEMFGRHANLE